MDPSTELVFTKPPAAEVSTDGAMAEPLAASFRGRCRHGTNACLTQGGTAIERSHQGGYADQLFKPDQRTHPMASTAYDKRPSEAADEPELPLRRDVRITREDNAVKVVLTA